VRKKLRKRSLGGRPDVHILSAGGIVYRKRAGRIELFFVKDPFGRWSFPKGKVEVGESLPQTAVREIREETGLEGLALIAPLGKTMFRFWREAGLIEKTVHMFLFKASPMAKERLSGAGAIFEGAWMPVHVAFQVSGYRNSDRMLGEAMRLISNEEGVPWVSVKSDRVRRGTGVPETNDRRDLHFSKIRRRRDWKGSQRRTMSMKSMVRFNTQGGKQGAS
jgi:8-oxo-dGTP pyrophosphatase MutT (NUDIX family)